MNFQNQKGRKNIKTYIHLPFFQLKYSNLNTKKPQQQLNILIPHKQQLKHQKTKNLKSIYFFFSSKIRNKTRRKIFF